MPIGRPVNADRRRLLEQGPDRHLDLRIRVERLDVVTALPEVHGEELALVLDAEVDDVTDVARRLRLLLRAHRDHVMGAPGVVRAPLEATSEDDEEVRIERVARGEAPPPVPVRAVL